MIQIQDKVDCCGCNACGDVCAHNAISFKTDNEGFWYPEVDLQKCTDCHLCEKVCPILNIKGLKKNDYEKPICYAAEHKNMQVVFDSTSGGMFSAIADIIYRDKGYVGGAVFNKDFKSVRHYISNDKNDLPKLRSSKYLQSQCEGFYKEVQGLLKAGEKVMVCGGPCQMAALKAFLRRDYQNLLIVDYICRAIASPKAWRYFVQMFEEMYQSKVVYSKTKIKEYGWRNFGQKFIFENGKTAFMLTQNNPYQQIDFQKRAFCRPACFDCKFKGYPRIADITIADFWSIEQVNQDVIKDKDTGISCVLINSEKGKNFFERVKSRINYIPVNLREIEKGNFALNSSVQPCMVNREQFFKDMDEMRFDKLAEKYGAATINVRKRTKIKLKLRSIKSMLSFTQWNLVAIYRTLKYNSISSILKNHFFLISPNSFIQLEKGASFNLGGVVRFGTKKYSKSKLETKMLIEERGKLTTSGDISIGYGSDIEVFKDAHLSIGSGFATNLDCNIICGNKILIGKDVGCGRNVTIRDNNGGHYINIPGYKDASPVIIGDKVWLCESCTIMPGAKIGDGAIIGARSVVYGNIPPRTMVSGNPAKVIYNDVLFKA